MGWSGGSGLFGELIFVVQKNVGDESARREIYEHMIDAFRDHDWDTLDECLGSDQVFDDLYDELFPAIDEEDEDEDDH